VKRSYGKTAKKELCKTTKIKQQIYASTEMDTSNKANVLEETR